MQYYILTKKAIAIVVEVKKWLEVINRKSEFIML